MVHGSSFPPPFFFFLNYSPLLSLPGHGSSNRSSFSKLAVLIWVTSCACLVPGVGLKDTIIGYTDNWGLFFSPSLGSLLWDSFLPTPNLLWFSWLKMAGFPSEFRLPLLHCSAPQGLPSAHSCEEGIPNQETHPWVTAVHSLHALV